MVYDLFSQIAGSPYFNFIAGLCSMATLLAIVTYLKWIYNRPKITKVTHDEASKIISVLIEKQSSIVALSFLTGVPVIIGMLFNNINLSRSFLFYVKGNSGSVSDAKFYLVQTRKRLMLFANLDILKPEALLLSDNKSHPEIKSLQDLFLNIKKQGDETPVALIIKNLQGL